MPTQIEGALVTRRRGAVAMSRGERPPREERDMVNGDPDSDDGNRVFGVEADFPIARTSVAVRRCRC